jgi:N-acetylneuraminate synthase/sialic acid synthase
LSLEPIGMHKMIRDLRRVRQALGDGVKRALDAETDAITKMGKKLVAVRDLSAGHTLTADDLAVKSPGDGMPPVYLDALIGKRLSRAIAADENLTFDLLDAQR